MGSGLAEVLVHGFALRCPQSADSAGRGGPGCASAWPFTRMAPSASTRRPRDAAGRRGGQRTRAAEAVNPTEFKSGVGKGMPQDAPIGRVETAYCRLPLEPMGDAGHGAIDSEELITVRVRAAGLAGEGY